MGNVQHALETAFCEAAGCPDDAAPGARYCPRHMRARLAPRPDCAHFRCYAPALLDSPYCEPHMLIEDARSLPPRPKETTVEPVPERPVCHIEGCSNPSAPWTVGARKQGGRYDICDAHLEELNERARETRRATMAARARPGVSTPPEPGTEDGEAAPLAGEGPGSEPPRTHPAWCYSVDGADHDGSCVDWAGRTALDRAEGFITEIAPGEATRMPDGARTPAGFPLPLVVEPTMFPFPPPDLLSVSACESTVQHVGHAWPDGPDKEYWCRGLNADGTAPYDPLRAGFDATLSGYERVPVLVAPHVYVSEQRPVRAALREAAGFEPDHDGPERPPTWAERGALLAEVGADIDRLEAELEIARARWARLASDG